MRSFLHLPLIGFFALASVSLVQAQLPMVDIAMVPLEDGRYEVRLRPDLYFDGLFAAVVFTLRWDAGSSTTFSFDEAQELSDIGMSINPSGTAVDERAYRYLSYTGFGGAPFYASGYAWNADQEFVLGYFIVTNGPANVVVVEDEWTAGHNGNYYISLNGQDRTGEIYEVSTRIATNSSAVPIVGVVPNPSRDLARLSLEWPVSENVLLEVIDTQGRTCARSSFVTVAGSNTIPLDATQFADGSYKLQLIGDRTQQSTTWVVQHQ